MVKKVGAARKISCLVIVKYINGPGRYLREVTFNPLTSK